LPKKKLAKFYVFAESLASMFVSTLILMEATMLGEVLPDSASLKMVFRTLSLQEANMGPFFKLGKDSR
jgi:hypothetical protein